MAETAVRSARLNLSSNGLFAVGGFAGRLSALSGRPAWQLRGRRDLDEAAREVSRRAHRPEGRPSLVVRTVDGSQRLSVAGDDAVIAVCQALAAGRSLIDVEVSGADGRALPEGLRFGAPGQRAPVLWATPEAPRAAPGGDLDERANGSWREARAAVSPCVVYGDLRRDGFEAAFVDSIAGFAVALTGREPARFAVTHLDVGDAAARPADRVARALRDERDPPMTLAEAARAGLDGPAAGAGREEAVAGALLGVRAALAASGEARYRHGVAGPAMAQAEAALSKFYAAAFGDALRTFEAAVDPRAVEALALTRRATGAGMPSIAGLRLVEGLGGEGMGRLRDAALASPFVAATLGRAGLEGDVLAPGAAARAFEARDLLAAGAGVRATTARIAAAGDAQLERAVARGPGGLWRSLSLSAAQPLPGEAATMKAYFDARPNAPAFLPSERGALALVARLSGVAEAPAEYQRRAGRAFAALVDAWREGDGRLPRHVGARRDAGANAALEAACRHANWMRETVGMVMGAAAPAIANATAAELVAGHCRAAHGPANAASAWESAMARQGIPAAAAADRDGAMRALAPLLPERERSMSAQRWTAVKCADAGRGVEGRCGREF